MLPHVSVSKYEAEMMYRCAHTLQKSNHRKGGDITMQPIWTFDVDYVTQNNST